MGGGCGRWQELRSQMAHDSDKRRHQFRMSEKERQLNRQSMDFFASERGLQPSSRPLTDLEVAMSERGLTAGHTPPLQIMHDFSYQEAFRCADPHVSKPGRRLRSWLHLRQLHSPEPFLCVSLCLRR